jgi:DNA polymerase-3 subunit delta'
MSALDLPWLAAALARLPPVVPAALLLHGQRGMGKNLLARSLARSILCEAPRGMGRACGNCSACRLMDAGTHPDYRELLPGAEDSALREGGEIAPARKPGVQIPVSAVRELADLSVMSSHRGRGRVALISPAESLHSSAANALLKILEEPPPGMHFLLVSHEPQRLLPTVISRCFRLPVARPAPEVAVRHLATADRARAELALALSGYAPIAAGDLIADQEFWTLRAEFFSEFWRRGSDPLELASRAEAFDPAMLARLLLMACHDLLAGKHELPARYHLDYQGEIRARGAVLSAASIAGWVDRILQYARSAYHPLNRRLALEALFAALPET